MAIAWRNIVAMLANPDLRTAYAEVILAEHAATPLTDAQRATALVKLERSGILIRNDEGDLAVDSESLRVLLAEPADRPSREGFRRFLRADGRIDRFPATRDERLAFLEWLTAQAFVPGEVLVEKQVNQRLSSLSDDVALVRRSLIDHGLLERAPDGGSYWLPAK
ncbi:DUF2087 domain-containing protein [Glaciibacter psychrotolerans]|uniref:DUF2087 domain-containing protein n=1 Tax=Glaciibacter psychrotolerans TaxID=670054 RepID=A0A7Z0J5G1_9MICO|nr:DUF2087 domain-containing protein [Leifsonia psychrotolerans]NYJ18859.1 hypothetical protein [Leifsonia psychrotolerans]